MLYWFSADLNEESHWKIIYKLSHTKGPHGSKIPKVRVMRV